MLLLPLNLILAQETHWQCNIYDFQYDMTVYLDVTVDGKAISDYSNYEVAAFCGEECRGIASLEEIPNTEKKYYYLRIRSNQNEGKTISFKVYDKEKAKEYSIAENTITFSAQSMQGYPSSPVVLGLANNYRLTYIVDGVEYKTVTVTYGTAITAETEPTKEGHTFSGWSEVPATMPAKDVAVVGTFSANKYAVVYTLDGETFRTDSVTFGTAIVLPDAPAKEGHTFAGWIETPETMPAKDVTVTGSYTVNQYTLTYKVDNAEYKKVTLDYGTAITAETEPTKEGHTFSGWSEVPATMPAKDVTIVGTFTINKYVLTYVIDGAEYKRMEVEYGTAITAEDAPTKEGYIFSGWSEIPAIMPAKDVTVTGTFSVDGIDAVVTNQLVNVYTLQGVMVKRQVVIDELENELPAGLYIVNGKKMIIR